VIDTVGVKAIMKYESYEKTTEKTRMTQRIGFDPADIEKWIKSCKKEPVTDYNGLQTVTGSPRKGVN
jgi:hypothetical protein